MLGKERAMTLAISKEFAKFTPAELERIAGIPPEMQRVWRSRGHLPKNEGAHARYDALLVASLMVRKALMSLGVGQAEISDLSYEAARHVLWWALSQGGGAWAVTQLGGKSVQRDVARRFDDLPSRILQLNEGEAHRFIARGADGEAALTSEIVDFFKGQEVGFFVYLGALATRLVNRAGRPLLRVTVAKAEDLGGPLWSKHT